MQNSFPNEFKSLSILSGWEIVSEIGHGGTGVVYELKGEQGEKAALKWVHLQKRGSQQNLDFINAQTRLINELGLQIQLGNEVKQIAAIRDHAVVTSPDGSAIDAFIRMDLLKPLNKWLEERPHSIKEILEMLKDVSVAVDACHKAGILHRDIKPENILMDGSGFKLGDFGVAGIIGIGDEQTKVTKVYAPPEYIKDGEWDELGDIYALALTAYIIFNNDLIPYQQSPSRDDLNKALAAKREAWQSGHPFYKPPRYAPNEEAARVLCKGSAIAKKERYTSAVEFYDQLLKAIGDDERILNQLLPYREYTSVPREENTSVGGVFGRTTDNDTETARETMQVLTQTKPALENDSDKKPQDKTDDETSKGKGIITGFDYDPDDTKGSDTFTGFSITEEVEPPKKRKLWLIPVLIILLAAIGFGAYRLFAPEKPIEASVLPTPTPVPEATFKVTFMTDTAVLYGELGEYTYYPNKAEYLKQTIATDSEETELRGLLPETQYTFVGSNGGTVKGMTSRKGIDELSLRDSELHLYNCNKSRAYSEGIPVISKLGTSSAPQTTQIAMERAVSSDDVTAYVLKLSLSLDLRAKPIEGKMIRLVLEPENGSLCYSDMAVSFSSRTSQTFVWDLTFLLEDLYQRNNGTPEGMFKLSAYLGDVRLGQVSGIISKDAADAE